MFLNSCSVSVSIHNHQILLCHPGIAKSFQNGYKQIGAFDSNVPYRGPNQWIIRVKINPRLLKIHLSLRVAEFGGGGEVYTNGWLTL